MSRIATLSIAFHSDLEAARRAYDEFAQYIEGRTLKIPVEWQGPSSGAPAPPAPNTPEGGPPSQTFGGLQLPLAAVPFTAPPSPASITPTAAGPIQQAISPVVTRTLADAFSSAISDVGRRRPVQLDEVGQVVRAARFDELSPILRASREESEREPRRIPPPPDRPQTAIQPAPTQQHTRLTAQPVTPTTTTTYALPALAAEPAEPRTQTAIAPPRPPRFPPRSIIGELPEPEEPGQPRVGRVESRVIEPPSLVEPAALTAPAAPPAQPPPPTNTLAAPVPGTPPPRGSYALTRPPGTPPPTPPVPPRVGTGQPEPPFDEPDVNASPGGRGLDASLFRFYTRHLAVRAVGEGIAALDSQREINRDELLAGRDPAAQLKAQQAERQRLASGGIIGRTIVYAQDPGGEAEAGVNATLASAMASDARASAAGRSQAFLRNLRDQATAASLGPSYAARRNAVESSVIAQRGQIQAARTADSDTINQQLAAEETQAQLNITEIRRTTHVDEPGILVRSDVAAKARADIAAEQQRVADLRHDLFARQQARFGPAETYVNTIEQAGLEEIRSAQEQNQTRLETDTRASGLRAVNQPIRAGFAELTGSIRGAVEAAPAEDKVRAAVAGFSRLLEFGGDLARSFRYSREDLQGASNVLQARLRRDPLGADLAEIENQRRTAQRAVPNLSLFGFDVFSPVRRQIDENAGLRRQGAVQEDEQRQRLTQGTIESLGLRLQHQPIAAAIAEIRAQTETQIAGVAPFTSTLGIPTPNPAFFNPLTIGGLQEQNAQQQREDQVRLLDIGITGERESLQAQLARNPIGARAIEIESGGLGRAEELRQGRFTDQAVGVLKNAKLSEDVLKQGYLDAFRGQQIDLRSINVQNARDVEDPQAVLSAIQEQTDRLERAINDLKSD